MGSGPAGRTPEMEADGAPDREIRARRKAADAGPPSFLGWRLVLGRLFDWRGRCLCRCHWSCRPPGRASHWTRRGDTRLGWSDSGARRRRRWPGNRQFRLCDGRGSDAGPPRGYYGRRDRPPGRRNWTFRLHHFRWRRRLDDCRAFIQRHGDGHGALRTGRHGHRHGTLRTGRARSRARDPSHRAAQPAEASSVRGDWERSDRA